MTAVPIVVQQFVPTVTTLPIAAPIVAKNAIDGHVDGPIRCSSLTLEREERQILGR
jgi:hypothetical protein